MKHPALLLAALASLAMETMPAISQEPAPAWPQDVQIELQAVTLPEPLAMELIPDLLDGKKIEAANTRLQKLLTEGKAQLAGWLVLPTRSGQRAVVQSVEELRFATQFDPGQMAVSVQAPKADAAQGDTIKVSPKIQADGIDPVPTAFQMRECGLTLEVEPVLAPDGETVDLNIVPQHVRLLRWAPVTIKHGESGKEVTVQQPVFSSLRVTTSLTLKSGQRKLVGNFKITDPPGSMELFLLRVEVQKLPAAASGKAP